MPRAAARALALVALAGTAVIVGCGPRGGLTAAVRSLGAAPAGDLLVMRPAQQLALSLADLPPGFQVGEELIPRSAPPADDPWGRLSAYAITYVPASGEATTGTAGMSMGNVVSSVNAYTGKAQASGAFSAWREAIPNAYRQMDQAPALGDETAVYVREVDPAQRGARPTCLVGIRVRNVMASVSVAGPAGAAAPVETAIRLARLTVQRIQSVAGR